MSWTTFWREGCLKRLNGPQIRISDHGPGINFSHPQNVAFTAGFSTNKSLGTGFSVILSIYDRVMLSTSHSSTPLALEPPDDQPTEETDQTLDDLL